MKPVNPLTETASFCYRVFLDPVHSNPGNKICGFKNVRIRVSGALALERKHRKLKLKELITIYNSTFRAIIFSRKINYQKSKVNLVHDSTL